MNHIELYAMEIDQREPSPIKAVTIPDQCDNAGWESFDNRWNDTFIMKYMDESFNGVRSVYIRDINLDDDHRRIEFTNASMQGFKLICIDISGVYGDQYVYDFTAIWAMNLILCMVAQRLDAKDVVEYESDNKKKMHDDILHNISNNIWEQVTKPSNILRRDVETKCNINTNGKDVCNNG